MAQHPKQTEKPKKLSLKKLDSLFKAEKKSSSSSDQLLGSTVLYNLLLVRPWLLVGGFWVVLMVTSAIALGGLRDPGKSTAQEPISTTSAAEELTIAPDAAASSRLTESIDTEVRLDPAASLQGEAPQPMPVWPLWIMVLACAGGCFMMSRQGVPAPSLRKSRSRKSSPSSTASSTQPTPKGLAKLKRSGKARKSKSSDTRRRSARSKASARKTTAKRLKPQYPSSQVMAIQNTQDIRQVKPTQAKAISTVQSLPDQSSKAQSPAIVSFNMKPTPIAVVPSEETLPLDWQEGSLAHRLDVRQKRSLNSLL